MSKLFIPPTLLVYGIIFIVLFYFTLPGFNLISFPFNLLGILISFYGFTIMGKARDLHRKYDTTLTISESAHLITEGIFTKSRNPMYLGMFLLLLGIGICFGNLFSMITPFLFPLLTTIFIIPREERLLSDTFGEEYLDYKKKVRRWI